MKRLKILPLGGLGEIGMNCLVLEYDGRFVLVDCGIQFPDSRYAGVDLLTPDLSYIRERAEGLLGIVITHGHDDHIGAIPFLAKHLPLDVHSTPFPRGLVEQKLTEYSDLKEVRFHEIRPRKRFTLGPFTFDPIPVQHSIIESLGFAIETPVGVVVHTGDFKHDASDAGGPVKDFQAFEEWGNKGVHLLLSDSTNAERLGHTISEQDVVNSFENIFRGQKGRLLIALFASNIRRIENLLWLAHRQGKRVAFEGRSMHSYVQLAHAQGSIRLPEGTLILLEDIHQHPDDRVVVLLTGSQAEPQSALVRVSHGMHKTLKIKPTDRVLMSSRFIPGNERAITAMIDHLYRQGAEVIYESIHQIHVSGHGFQEELAMMLKATRPKLFIPIHGEFRHLAMHAKLARANGVREGNTLVIEDGQAVEVGRDGLVVGEKRELQKGVIVSGAFMSATPALFTQRAALAKTGVVYATFLRKNKKLAARPRVGAYGVLLPEGEDPLGVAGEIEALLEDRYPELAKQADVTEAVRLEVRRFFKKKAVLKPAVISLFLDI